MNTLFFKGMAIGAGAVALAAVAAVAVVGVVKKRKEDKANESFEYECCFGDCDDCDECIDCNEPDSETCYADVPKAESEEISEDVPEEDRQSE